VALLGGTWNADFTAYTGPLYIPQGSSFAAYDPSRFVVGDPVGTGTLTFSNASTARLDTTIRGVSGTKNIVRQPFGPPDATPVGSFADLWWAGTSQNGWGITISQQYRTLFAVWFTYDTQGRNTWFVVPGGTWTAGNVFTGTAYRTTSSPWVGATYDPSRFQITPAGTVTFTFGADGKSAGMAYTLDGLSGSNVITRQPL
jgi:chitinase